MGLILPTALSGPRTVPLAFKCRGWKGCRASWVYELQGLPTQREWVCILKRASFKHAGSPGGNAMDSPGLIRWTGRRWLGKVAC